MTTPGPERIAVVEPAAGAGTALGADFPQVRMLLPAEIEGVLASAEPPFGCVGVAGFTDAAALSAAVAAVAATGPDVVLVDRGQPGADVLAAEPLRVRGTARVSGRSCVVLAAAEPPRWLQLEPVDAPLPAADPLQALVPYTRQLDARVSAAEAERDALADRLRRVEAELTAARTRATDLQSQVQRLRRAPAMRLATAARGRRAAIAGAGAVLVAALAVLVGLLTDVAAGLVTALLLVTVPALAYVVLGLRRVGRSVGRIAEQVRVAESAAATERRTVRGRLDWLQQALRNDAERSARLERQVEIVAAATVDTAHALGDLLPPDKPDIPAAG